MVDAGIIDITNTKDMKIEKDIIQQPPSQGEEEEQEEEENS